MNAQRFAAALFAAVAFAGPAMAMEPTVDTTAFVSTKTRAEVRADVLAAHRAGAVDTTGEFAAEPTTAAAPAVTASREQVRAEAIRAARAQRTGQDNGYTAG